MQEKLKNGDVPTVQCQTQVHENVYNHAALVYLSDIKSGVLNQVLATASTHTVLLPTASTFSQNREEFSTQRGCSNSWYCKWIHNPYCHLLYVIHRFIFWTTYPTQGREELVVNKLWGTIKQTQRKFNYANHPTSLGFGQGEDTGGSRGNPYSMVRTHRQELNKRPKRCESSMQNCVCFRASTPKSYLLKWKIHKWWIQFVCCISYFWITG